VTSQVNESFRRAFANLPRSVQARAREAYRLFLQDPHHPSLHFRQVHARLAIYSVRIGINYRALGAGGPTDVVWFWIGSHAEYDRLLRSM
jgi:hypothetical protein